MQAKAIIPARTIALREPSPIVGEIVLKLEVSILNGSAPEFIWSASFLADSYVVNEPEITASPSVIAVLTVGADIMVLSIHIEIGVSLPASSVVASANLSLPESLRTSLTTFSYSP